MSAANPTAADRTVAREIIASIGQSGLSVGLEYIASALYLSRGPLAAVVEELCDLCPRISDDDPAAPAIRAALERARVALRAAGRPLGSRSGGCGVLIPGTQNLCTRTAGHDGDHRCSAGDVDDRAAGRIP